MKTLLSLCGLTAAALLLATALAISQDKKAQTEDSKADEPGPVHKALAHWVGEYDTVSKFRGKPGDEPIESKGTAKISTALDGRFLLEENTGTQFGQSYKGLRLIGYNNAKKEYEAVWTYSMSTAIMMLNGTSKDNGKTVDWTASYTDEHATKQTMSVTTRKLDDDRFVVELAAQMADGKKGPTVETTYTRRKQNR
jgi:hypothetical protein